MSWNTSELWTCTNCGNSQIEKWFPKKKFWYSNKTEHTEDGLIVSTTCKICTFVRYKSFPDNSNFVSQEEDNRI